MSLNDVALDEVAPPILVALSGFVLALLSAFLPRVGGALVAAALFGSLAAAALVGRRRESVLQALPLAAGPAVGVGVAGTLLASDPVRAALFHVGSGIGLALCAVLAGFAVGTADARLSEGRPAVGRREAVGFVALFLVGAGLVAATGPYAAVHAPLPPLT